MCVYIYIESEERIGKLLDAAIVAGGATGASHGRHPDWQILSGIVADMHQQVCPQYILPNVLLNIAFVA